jgi:hypothetical protein
MARSTKPAEIASATVGPPGPVAANPAKPQRSPAALAELEAYNKRFPHRRNLAPMKVTEREIFIDHPDQVLAGTRLAAVLATDDDAFIRKLIGQVAHLSSTRGKVDPLQMDFMLATVKEIGPRDPIESLLAVQMAAIHDATVMAAKLLKTAEFVETRDHALVALNKCARTFALQVETLKKHRSTGEQTVRVQHVTVNDGGQAIVADKVVAGGGGISKKETQPHEPKATGQGSPHEWRPALHGQIEAVGTPMPSSGTERAQSVPVPRSTRRGANRRAQRPLHNGGSHH